MRFLFLLLLPFWAMGQVDTVRHVPNPIFRVCITPPPFELTIISFHAEYQFQFPISVYAKVGPTVYTDDFGDGSGFDKLRFSYNFLASGEARFYLLHHKKMKQYKGQVYYYGPYFSLEQQLFTNAWAKSSNLPQPSTQRGQLSTSLNLGWQKQFGKGLYLNASVGKILYAKVLKKDDNSEPDDLTFYFGLGVKL